MEVSMVVAAVRPQRMGDGSSILDRVVLEATPYVLFAYPYIGKASGGFRRVIDNLRKNCGARIFVDSGGFELAKGTAHGIDPEEVVRFQNMVADMGFILDFPPDHLPFDDCLKMTADHVLAAAKIEKKFEYFLVVHGRTMEQMREWYGKLRELDQYQGISVSGIELSELLRGFIFAVEEKGWKYWHFLGTSSMVQISLIQYFAKKLTEEGRTDVERITFDSSTPTQYGRACKILHPLLPIEAVHAKSFTTEFLKSVGSDFDGSAQSAILHNVKSQSGYNKILSRIHSSGALAEWTEGLLSRRMRWKWTLGRQVIDAAFSQGTGAALKLIPPELDRVKGLEKKRSILQL